MKTCDQYRELLFDHLYGLLETAEDAALRDHLAGCEGCRAALGLAKLDQAKIAQAALAVRDVPEFTAPTIREETAPASEPVLSPALPRRGFGWMKFAAFVAAACALFAVYLGYRHNQDIHSHEALVAQSQTRVNDIDGLFVSLDKSVQRELAETPAALKKEAVQVVVSGPAQVLPGVSAPFQLALRDLEGKAVSGRVEVEFLGEKAEALAAKQSVVTDEFAQLSAPMMKLERDTAARLRVTVPGKVGLPPVVLEEAIQIQTRSFAAHLLTNKQIYRPGEKVLVRALVLDRHALTPPSQPMNVKIAILANEQPIVPPALMSAFVGGMAAGELTLPAALKPGEYVVQLSGEKMQSVSRFVEVAPASPSPVDVFVQTIRAGEATKNQAQLADKDGKPAANVAYQIQGSINEQNNSVGNAAAQNNTRNFAYQNRANFNEKGKTDERGQLSFNVPAAKELQSGRGQLDATVTYGGDGKDKQTASVNVGVKLVPSKLFVDFHPEGGRLIAGAPNRVHYRVRSQSGDTVVPEGQIVFFSKADVVHRFEPGRAIGSFDFTPNPAETYSVRVSSPKQDDLRDPFKELGIETEGVLLRGDAVQPGDQPLRIRLENYGKPRLAQIVATCRDQIVFHRRTALSAEPVAVDMPLSLDGIVRVTVFEVGESGLTPLCERLFHRTPTRRLDLSAELETDKLPTGQNQAQLRVRGLDEAGKPIACLAVAAVVDERFRGDSPEASLRDHFLLLGDLRDADLSNVPVVAIDANGPKPSLESALGILGWRRFAPKAGEVRQAVAAKPAAESLTFFHRAVPSTEEMRRQIEQRWQTAQIVLLDAAQKRRGELHRDRDAAARQLSSARAELAEAHERPRQTSLGGLGLVLFGAGVFAILWGMTRLARRQSATRSFAVACACVGACLFLVIARPPADVATGPPATADAAKPREDREMKRTGAAIAWADVGKVSTEQRYRLGEWVAEPEGRMPEKDAAFGGPGGGGAAQPMPTAAGPLSQTANSGLRGASREAEKAASDKQADRTLELNKSDALAGKRSPVEQLGGGAGGLGGGQAGVAPMAKMQPAPPAAPGAGGPQAAIGPKHDAPGIEGAAKKADGDRKERADLRIDVNNLPRQYLARRGVDVADGATLLWQPVLEIPAAGVRLPIDIPAGAASYRILILGHTDSGRFGILENQLRVK